MINDTNMRFQILAEKLRARGQRLTPQRMAVLKVLVRDLDHPDIDAIYNEVKADFPMTSLATIYKTISTLKEINEVREIHIGDGNNRYDAKNMVPHPHLICIKCDKIIDVHINNFAEMSSELEKQTGYMVVEQRLDFFGICPKCQSSK